MRNRGKSNTAIITSPPIPPVIKANPLRVDRQYLLKTSINPGCFSVDTVAIITSFIKNKRLPLYARANTFSAVQPSIKTFPEARSNYDPTAAIELWLSVPRLLGGWLCRIY